MGCGASIVVIGRIQDLFEANGREPGLFTDAQDARHRHPSATGLGDAREIFVVDAADAEKGSRIDSDA